jgi:hypothetical protein
VYAWCRLSKLPLKDHRLVREDPRFLQLVRLAEGKLQSRPKELQAQQLGNMINGEDAERCQGFAWLMTEERDLLPPAPGLAKLEYRPEEEFLRLFVEVCMTSRLEGFKPQELSNVINGELVYTAEAARVSCSLE